MTKRNATKPAAATLYAENLAAVRAQLARIEKALAEHAAKAAAKPEHYGYAGDLGHVLEQLRDVLPE